MTAKEEIINIIENASEEEIKILIDSLIDFWNEK